jgi:uncharacterized membrane protein YhaH (DUF805 family)
MARLANLSSFLLLTRDSLGAQPRADDAGAAAAGALGCLGCSTIMLLPIILLIVQIAVLVWVAKDSKSRGMDGAVVWMIFVFVVPVIGLIVYILSRPTGALIKCPSCGNQRLQVAVKCPHCGN